LFTARSANQTDAPPLFLNNANRMHFERQLSFEHHSADSAVVLDRSVLYQASYLVGLFVTVLSCGFF